MAAGSEAGVHDPSDFDPLRGEGELGEFAHGGIGQSWGEQRRESSVGHVAVHFVGWAEAKEFAVVAAHDGHDLHLHFMSGGFAEQRDDFAAVRILAGHWCALGQLSLGAGLDVVTADPGFKGEYRRRRGVGHAETAAQVAERILGSFVAKVVGPGEEGGSIVQRENEQRGPDAAALAQGPFAVMLGLGEQVVQRLVFGGRAMLAARRCGWQFHISMARSRRRPAPF